MRILLFGIGVSSIGDFIYLVALNIFVLQKTNSAIDVAGLWAVPMLAALLVGPWIGSFTDRFPYRRQLYVVEFIRTLLVFLLPFLPSIWLIYLDIFILGIASTIFNNVFMPFRTLLVPREHRKHFNAEVSMLRSGSVLIGPAIAGFLLRHGDVHTAIWLDALSFLISSVVLLFLPDLRAEKTRVSEQRQPTSIRSDWKTAIIYLAQNHLFTLLYFFSVVTQVLGMTADSQEVVFAQNALHLGRFGYSMMVVAAGVGFVAGSLILLYVAKKIPTVWLIGVGSPIAATGYLIYALSHSFWWAVCGLVILGIFGTAQGVGMGTYMQNSLPVEQMGRIRNVIGPPRQILGIVMMVVGGYIANLSSVRVLMVSMTIPMSILGLLTLFMLLRPHNRVLLSHADRTDSSM